MNKVAFEIERNKELFDKTLAELSTYDWENLRLFDRYYLKNKSFVKSNIVLIEFVDDQLYVDKLPIQQLMQLKTSQDMARLCVLVEFIMKLNESKIKKVGKKRYLCAKQSKIKSSVCKGYIEINNIVYAENVNRNKSYEWSMDSFEVRGHIRTYKNGKKVFVKSYKKEVRL